MRQHQHHMRFWLGWNEAAIGAERFGRYLYLIYIDDINLNLETWIENAPRKKKDVSVILGSLWTCVVVSMGVTALLKPTMPHLASAATPLQ